MYMFIPLSMKYKNKSVSYAVIYPNALHCLLAFNFKNERVNPFSSLKKPEDFVDYHQLSLVCTSMARGHKKTQNQLFSEQTLI